jgi:hypothetical protein
VAGVKSGFSVCGRSPIQALQQSSDEDWLQKFLDYTAVSLAVKALNNGEVRSEVAVN